MDPVSHPIISPAGTVAPVQNGMDPRTRSVTGCDISRYSGDQLYPSRVCSACGGPMRRQVVHRFGGYGELLFCVAVPAHQGHRAAAIAQGAGRAA